MNCYNLSRSLVVDVTKMWPGGAISAPLGGGGSHPPAQLGHPLGRQCGFIKHGWLGNLIDTEALLMYAAKK